MKKSEKMSEVVFLFDTMKFDGLPSEIKRLIFDKNREAAKQENLRKRNFEMLQLEMKMLFRDADFPWHKVKPQHLTQEGFACKDKEPDDQLELYYCFANRDVLPLDKFVAEYMTGLCDGDAETCFEEVREWDREKPFWYPNPLCLEKGHCVFLDSDDTFYPSDEDDE